MRQAKEGKYSGSEFFVPIYIFREPENISALCIQDCPQNINHKQHLLASVRCRLLLICGNHNQLHTSN